jgi:hypothetical protein
MKKVVEMLELDVDVMLMKGCRKLRYRSGPVVVLFCPVDSFSSMSFL